MNKESMRTIRDKLTKRPSIPGLQKAVWKELEPLRLAMLRASK